MFITKAGMVMATTVVCGSRKSAAIGAPITGKPMPVTPLTKAANTIPKAASRYAGVNAAGTAHPGVRNHRNAMSCSTLMPLWCNALRARASARYRSE